MLSLPSLARKFTRGFRIAKLHLDFPFQPEWEVDPDPAVHAILHQNYSFIGKGSQCYVFESADRRYVVKLFRFDNPAMDVPRLFHACKLAYDRLREETGVVYIHLNPTRLGFPPFCCKDAIGRRYELCLDSYRFVLQRRSDPFLAVLMAARSDPLLMQKRLDQFIDLLQTRAAKEVLNVDPNLSRNFGFLDDRAIEFDFGNYQLNPGLNRSAEIRHYASKLRPWLEENAPEWVAYLDRRTEALP